MPEKKRLKKAGQDKGKKNQARRRGTRQHDVAVPRARRRTITT
jgi:hypothetical protein